MHFALHRFLRKVIISEIQGFLNDHPFYSNTQPNKFTSSPTIVTERYNFEGRHFPIVIVTTTDSDEKRLSMDRMIDEVLGHVRATSMISYVAVKVGDDPTFQLNGVYNDSRYLLEVVNVGPETDENMQLRVTQTEPNVGTPKFYDFPEDGVLTNIIPGARIIFGAFNDRRPGQRMEVQTFADKRYLGDVYGSRFDVTMGLQVYAQTTNEAEELLDLINAYALYMLPHRLYYGHQINLLTTKTRGIEKDGKLGEEAFKGEITLNLSVEHNMFIPFEIIESGTLHLSVQKDAMAAVAPGDILTTIAEWGPFTVQFDSMGGTLVSPIIGVPSGTTVMLPTPPTKTGFGFSGWNTDSRGYGTWFDETTPVMGNITVYAMWG